MTKFRHEFTDEPISKAGDIDIDYRILFDAAPLGIFTYSSRGEVLGANQFLLEMLGSPCLEATKEIDVFTFRNLVESGISDALRNALESNGPRELECHYSSKWGKEVDLSVIAMPMVSGPSTKEVGLGIFQDITQVKTSQDALIRVQERFSRLIDRTPLGIAILNACNCFEYTNPTFTELFGYCMEETPALDSWLTKIAGNDRLGRDIKLHLESDQEMVKDSRHFKVHRASGKAKYVQFRSLVLDDKRVLICVDHTDLVAGAFGPRFPEKRCLGLLEDLIDFVYTLDLDGNVLSINKAAARSLGYDPEEVLGRSVEKLIPEEVHTVARANMERVKKEGCSEGVSQYLGADGSIRYLEYRSALISSERQPEYVVGIARDVTERVLTKKALKESEAKFKIIVESAHDGIAHVDPDGVVQFCNQRMKEILKDPCPEGKPLHIYYDESNRRILEENLMVRSAGKSGTYFINLTDLEGNDHKLVVSGTPYFDERGKYHGAIGIFTDISELRKLEEQLQQSQKMEAIGTLAGGIAHDFNNILSGVLGYASLLRRHTEAGSQLAHYAEMVEKSAERGALLAGQLLAFSRKGKRFVQDVDVHQLIDDVVEIFERTIDRKIAVYSRKNAVASAISGDPGQIQQVLMNLCINAKDAMPDGGYLLISTETVQLDQAFCRANECLAPGPYLEIKVEDSGEGMSEQTKQRLFEPFFTTKEEGKGTGLGLSMVYGTVKSHGGLISVDSEPGRGAAFSVLLPLKICKPTEERVCSEPVPKMKTGMILVVDDEEIIRYLLSEMLRELGFEVLTAEDGIEGVDIYRDYASEVDIVLIDMIMPRMNGKETFLEMKKINPNVKAILSTGYTKDEMVREALDHGIAGFIQKPYRVEELSQVLAAALQECE
jgi:PAS domain S-box-containing protein